jgi:hypothetical protein
MPVQVSDWRECCAMCRLAQDCVAWTSETVPQANQFSLLCWLSPGPGLQVVGPGANVSGLLTR